MAKRSKRKGGRIRPVGDDDRVPVILHPHSTPAYRDRVVHGSALLADVMLARCPCFGATPTPDGVRVMPKLVPLPAVCQGCARDPEAINATGECPVQIDRETALMMILPPEVLHAEAEPESGLIVPGRQNPT